MTSKLKVSDFLHRKKVPVRIEPETTYSLVTVKIHHKGVVLREKKKGALLGSNMYQVSTGDFILSGIDARNGAFGIVPPELDRAVVTNDFWYFTLDESKVKRDFFYWLTTTPLFLDVCRKSSKGDTQRIRLQKHLFENFEFSFPPVEQQEEFSNELTKLDSTLSGLSMETSLQSSYLAQLRQSILQEAIEGRLTADWRRQYPVIVGDLRFDAATLISTINARQRTWVRSNESIYPEARTMDRKLSNIPKDLKPIGSIPATWLSVPVISIANIIVDCHNKTAPYSSKGIRILRTTNIRNMQINNIDERFVTSTTYEFWSRRCRPLPGDILFTREAPVGEVAIIPENQTVCLGQRIMLIRPFCDLFSAKYLLFSLSARSFLQRLSSKHKGAFVKHLRVGDVENAVIPMPPLAEQEAIVARVEKLLAIVDGLEEKVRERQKQAATLLQTVLREAFEPKTPATNDVVAEQPLTAFQQMQIVGSVIDMIGQARQHQGEMVVAKYLYLLTRLYGLRSGFRFQKWHFGPYDPAIKKVVSNRTYFTHSGRAGYQTLGIQKADFLFKYPNPQVDQIREKFPEILGIFGKYSEPERRAHKIELLATVLKAVEDSGTADANSVYLELAQWKTDETSTGFPSKAEKFTETEVRDCLEFCRKSGWV